MGTRNNDLAHLRVRLSMRAGLVIKSLAALIICLSPISLRADFIMTMSSGVYQSTDGKTKVILSNAEGAQGIFVTHLKDGVPPQEFNPEKIPAKDSGHVFIKFDPTSQNQYSEVTISDRTYKVAGNLNLWLTPDGGVSVNIDNTNPYITITKREASGKSDSLIGFYGMTEVVKGTGNLAAILSANQLSPDIAKIVKPYLIGQSGLTLNGKEVATATIGIFVNRDHECTTSNAKVSVLTLAQLQSIQKAKVESQQAQLLEKFMRENRVKSPTQGYLVLRADRSGPMILLNVASKDIFDMRQIKNTFSDRRICVLSPIR
jgi:hypothetical protein